MRWTTLVKRCSQHIATVDAAASAVAPALNGADAAIAAIVAVVAAPASVTAKDATAACAALMMRTAHAHACVRLTCCNETIARVAGCYY